MNRIPFSQVLKNASINPKQEYSRLYHLFCKKEYQVNYTEYCNVREYIEQCFLYIPLHGTCISLLDFDEKHGYNFNEYIPHNVDETDYLLSFCEYSYNLAYSVKNAKDPEVPIVLIQVMSRPLELYIEHVMTLIEKMGYIPNEKDGITDFVPNSQAAISVSEIIDPNLSYDVIEYNHHAMKGDLEKKRRILEALAIRLEDDENDKILKKFSTLYSELGFLLNHVHIRHGDGKQLSSQMDDAELESWYDETYQTMLLAFLEIDNYKRSEKIKELKQRLQ